MASYIERIESSEVTSTATSPPRRVATRTSWREDNSSTIAEPMVPVPPMTRMRIGLNLFLLRFFSYALFLRDCSTAFTRLTECNGNGLLLRFACVHLPSDILRNAFFRTRFGAFE